MMKLDFEFTVNPENAAAMAAYMRNRFEFIGLKAPARKEQSKPLLQLGSTMDLESLRQWIKTLYERDEREYQYLAIDLADKNVRRWQFSDIAYFKQFITQKSWWDSVDSWRTMFGKYIKWHPEEKQAVFDLFFGSDNFWERRVAINLQLMEKGNTNLTMLTKAILADQETDEFFIQKAIGWSLRQYSKTDPAWVRHFLVAHQMSRLAVKEGSKYL